MFAAIFKMLAEILSKPVIFEVCELEERYQLRRSQN